MTVSCWSGLLILSHSFASFTFSCSHSFSASTDLKQVKSVPPVAPSSGGRTQNPAACMDKVSWPEPAKISKKRVADVLTSSRATASFNFCSSPSPGAGKRGALSAPQGPISCGVCAPHHMGQALALGHGLPPPPLPLSPFLPFFPFPLSPLALPPAPPHGTIAPAGEPEELYLG